MSSLLEIGRLIEKLLKNDLTIWLVEEETGQSIKLYDYLNSTKNLESAIFMKMEPNKKPKCYNKNNDTYPLCKGINEKVCKICNLYENFSEEV